MPYRKVEKIEGYERNDKVPGYETWKAMKQTCYNANYSQYRDYGARGIEVCDSWKDSFFNFFKDMGPRPEGLTLERIDNNGNYEPGNCKWVTKAAQQYNTRKSGPPGTMNPELVRTLRKMREQDKWSIADLQRFLRYEHNLDYSYRALQRLVNYQSWKEVV